ncbi:MAG: hypothetical protein RJA16_1222, partial [Planctomycetota bacterium]
CERVVRLRDGLIERDEPGGGAGRRQDPAAELSEDAANWFALSRSSATENAD